MENNIKQDATFSKAFTFGIVIVLIIIIISICLFVMRVVNTVNADIAETLSQEVVTAYLSCTTTEDYNTFLNKYRHKIDRQFFRELQEYPAHANKSGADGVQTNDVKLTSSKVYGNVQFTIELETLMQSGSVRDTLSNLAVLKSTETSQKDYLTVLTLKSKFKGKYDIHYIAEVITGQHSGKILYFTIKIVTT